jgi:hypothetical protein
MLVFRHYQRALRRLSRRKKTKDDEEHLRVVLGLFFKTTSACYTLSHVAIITMASALPEPAAAATTNNTMNDHDDPPPKPINSLVTALLTDLYQITMASAHWKNNRHEDPAVFDLFFRMYKENK